jgi:hypothetical protein
MTPENRNLGAREMSNTRQCLGKHIPATTNKHAAIEEPVSKQRFGKHKTVGALLKKVSSVRSVQSGYKKSSVERSQLSFGVDSCTREFR